MGSTTESIISVKEGKLTNKGKIKIKFPTNKWFNEECVTSPNTLSRYIPFI